MLRVVKTKKLGRGIEILFGCRVAASLVGPPCRGRQVGEGISPTLDAQPLFICAVRKMQDRCASLSSYEFTARPLVQARKPATGIVVTDIPVALDRADAINNLAGLIEFKR